MLESEYEKIYVHDTYQQIASEFDKTRVRVWKQVQEFMDSIPLEDTIADIGCGNGKNLMLRPNTMVGYDICPEFITICKNKNLTAHWSDILNLQIMDNSYNHVICIAVIHHLSTEARRIKAIQELVRIVKPNGKILIMVWGVKGEVQDILLPFNSVQRYYHMFVEHELEGLCTQLQGVRILASSYQAENYTIILQKLQVEES